jgi:hypothetical protein
MNFYDEEIQLLQELLEIEKLPSFYVRVLQEESGKLQIPIAGLPLSLDLDSVWGATEFLRFVRSDLQTRLLVLTLEESRAFCLDLEQVDHDDAPVVEVELDNTNAPRCICDSLIRFLNHPHEAINTNAGQDDDLWFTHGLKRLDQHMNNLAYNYDHAQGGKLPRAHLWRPLRFCVQDVLLGLTVIRHDRKYNRLEVDVFLTAGIPEYEADSGCKALALIILSDAYKCGGSMEIKFTKEVEGGRVPHDLEKLAQKLGVKLEHVQEGGLTPQEAKKLYLALSGFKPALRDKVLELEAAGRISSASLCYAMHHGVWTASELEMIILGSAFPDSLLTGLFPPELWHLYRHDLLLGRNALMGGYLDRQLTKKEHWNSQGQEVVEMEDDERQIAIDFDPGLMAKIYTVGAEEDEPLHIPWLTVSGVGNSISPGKSFLVLLRGRETFDLDSGLLADIHQAGRLIKSNKAQWERVCVMVPADFRNRDTAKLVLAAEEQDVGLMICPEFSTHLDREVAKKMEAAKVMRQ